jgi:hypothetical protein
MEQVDWKPNPCSEEEEEEEEELTLMNARGKVKSTTRCRCDVMMNIATATCASPRCIMPTIPFHELFSSNDPQAPSLGVMNVVLWTGNSDLRHHIDLSITEVNTVYSSIIFSWPFSLRERGGRMRGVGESSAMKSYVGRERMAVNVQI